MYALRCPGILAALLCLVSLGLANGTSTSTSTSTGTSTVQRTLGRGINSGLRIRGGRIRTVMATSENARHLKYSKDRDGNNKRRRPNRVGYKGESEDIVNSSEEEAVQEEQEEVHEEQVEQEEEEPSSMDEGFLANPALGAIEGFSGDSASADNLGGGGFLSDFDTAMDAPIFAETQHPTTLPTKNPTIAPTSQPTLEPTRTPSLAPTPTKASQKGNRHFKGKRAKKQPNPKSKIREMHRLKQPKLSQDTDTDTDTDTASFDAVGDQLNQVADLTDQSARQDDSMPESPTATPTGAPTDNPTGIPTRITSPPTKSPTDSPTSSPTGASTKQPSIASTDDNVENSPTAPESQQPTLQPSMEEMTMVTITKTPTNSPTTITTTTTAATTTTQSTATPTATSTTSEPTAMASTATPTVPTTDKPSVTTTTDPPKPTNSPTATKPPAAVTPVPVPTQDTWMTVERPRPTPETAATIKPTYTNAYWSVNKALEEELVEMDCPSDNVQHFQTNIRVEYDGRPELLTPDEISTLERSMATLYNTESTMLCDSYFRNIQSIELQLGSRGYVFQITATCRDCPVDTTSLLAGSVAETIRMAAKDWFAEKFDTASESAGDSYYGWISQYGGRMVNSDGLTSRARQQERRRVVQEDLCYCPPDKSPSSPQAVTQKEFVRIQNVAIEELRTAGLITSVEGILSVQEIS
ncbi:Polymorphic outer membrane protein [Seminavis robusta]|uniref:Polymorphic outer membrane protein n=1 Tax=Seminavis robusta TaxID=568900 RepID=A0A9N8DAR8_9STRA|nr:Polymorphic outer membrane protein [Seminavis robusta]|eukprot:Sro60_g034850.1 Polymorphic outer membrane protein (696) ;mRNA; r:124285-126372